LTNVKSLYTETKYLSVELSVKVKVKSKGDVRYLINNNNNNNNTTRDYS